MVMWEALNWVDWAIIAIFSFSILLSLWRGIVREALSLVGWVVAFLLANLFGEQLAEQLTAVISNDTGRVVAAHVSIFVGVLLLANLAAIMLSRLVRLTGLGLMDRLLGTVFGFARALIIVLVIAFVAGELLSLRDQQMLRQSQLMPHLDIVLQWVQTVFSQLRSGAIPSFSI